MIGVEIYVIYYDQTIIFVYFIYHVYENLSNLRQCHYIDIYLYF